MLEKFCLDKHRFIFYDTTSSLTEFTVAVEIKGTYAGYFGKVKAQVAKQFDIQGSVFVAELQVAAFRSGWNVERKIAPLPKFPAVFRDLAFAVDQATPQIEVERVIWEAGKPLIRSATLFDVYEGEQAGSGKKSLAYAVEFQANDRTLAESEIDEVFRRIIRSVEQQCGAALRSSGNRKP